MSSEGEREILFQRVEALLKSHLGVMTAPRSCPGAAASTLQAEHFLYSLSAVDGDFDTDSLDVLSNLSREMEVYYRLHLAYDADLQPAAMDERVHPTFIQLLALLLLRAYCQTGDLRYVNTVLKVADSAVNAEAGRISPDVREVAIQCAWGGAACPS